MTSTLAADAAGAPLRSRSRRTFSVGLIASLLIHAAAVGSVAFAALMWPPVGLEDKDPGDTMQIVEFETPAPPMAQYAPQATAPQIPPSPPDVTPDDDQEQKPPEPQPPTPPEPKAAEPPPPEPRTAEAQPPTPAPPPPPDQEALLREALPEPQEPPPPVISPPPPPRPAAQQPPRPPAPPAARPPQAQQPGPPTSAPAPTMPANRGVSTVDYGTRAAAWLQRFMRYPQAARMRNEQGTVLLALNISPDGYLLDVRVQTGSGHASLDAAALSIARAASPFPAFGAGDGPSPREILIPMTFGLRQR